MHARGRTVRGRGGRGGPRGAHARRIGPRALYARLSEEYGQLDWWPATGPFEVLLGAVLTQRTSWSNVERALGGLRSVGADRPSDVLSMSRARLEAAIRPSGTYRQKAERLVSLCSTVQGAGGMEGLLGLPAGELRRVLLGIKGIGPETADSILLYAAGLPVFVVDAYTRRLLARLGREDVARAPYDDVASWFTRGLPRDAALYGNCHAVIVEHCKQRCRARPLCEGCPMLPRCPPGVARPGTR
jgi:endonuclease-3 related protein